VCSTAGLVLVLGIKAAVWHQDHLWAAGAIALASLAGAGLAVWHRREEWAFLASLGVNLAASMIVWHVHRAEPLDDWWVPLVQVNVIAPAAATLLWLWMRRRLYEPADRARAAGPWLALQVACSGVGNVALLLVPLGSLYFQPGNVAPDLVRVGGLGGY